MAAAVAAAAAGFVGQLRYGGGGGGIGRQLPAKSPEWTAPRSPEPTPIPAAESPSPCPVVEISPLLAAGPSSSGVSGPLKWKMKQICKQARGGAREKSARQKELPAKLKPLLQPAPAASKRPLKVPKVEIPEEEEDEEGEEEEEEETEEEEEEGKRCGAKGARGACQRAYGSCPYHQVIQLNPDGSTAKRAKASKSSVSKAIPKETPKAATVKREAEERAGGERRKPGPKRNNLDTPSSPSANAATKNAAGRFPCPHCERHFSTHASMSGHKRYCKRDAPVAPGLSKGDNGYVKNRGISPSPTASPRGSGSGGGGGESSGGKQRKPEVPEDPPPPAKGKPGRPPKKRSLPDAPVPESSVKKERKVENKAAGTKRGRSEERSETRKAGSPLGGAAAAGGKTKQAKTQDKHKAGKKNALDPMEAAIALPRSNYSTYVHIW